MKHLNLKALAISAMALGAGNALALNSTNIDGTEVKLYFGGATATDNAFANLFRVKEALGGVCVDGTLDFYGWSSAAGGTINQRLSFCTASINAGTGLAGSKIAVFKESAGGSAQGVTPVALATTRNFIPFSSAGALDLNECEAFSGTSVAATTTQAAYTSHTCSGAQMTMVGVAPNAGVSDVDPRTFVGLGGVTTAHANSLLATSTVGVTFNPIVSVALYRALQSAQGLTQDDTLANMPSMSLAQLRGIFSGTLTDGNQLYAYNNSTLSQAQVSAVTKTLYVCRRGNTSGTMTSFKILFLGEGCSKNPLSIGAFVKPNVVYSGTGLDEELNPIGTGLIDTETAGATFSSSAVLYNSVGTAITNGYGGVRVFAGSGSGDVRKCVHFHSAAGGGGTAGDFAIGTASTESKPSNTPNTALDNSYRYVRVDGVEPTLKATMEGRYTQYTENTFNRQSNTAMANFLAAGSNALNLYNGILSKIGTPLVLTAVNSSWVDAAAIGTVGGGEGDTGILDIPTSSNNLATIPVTAASVRSKPVNSQTRFYQTSANNCNYSKQSYP